MAGWEMLAGSSETDTSSRPNIKTRTTPIEAKAETKQRTQRIHKNYCSEVSSKANRFLFRRS